MRSRIQFLFQFSLLAVLGLASSVWGAPPPAPWLSDLPTAQAMARKEGKAVLIHFSGSDWCGWCMKLRKEVFLKQEFGDYAKSNLVLVLIDFPKHKPLPTSLQTTNQRVAEQFQVQGFPTMILLDSQGRRLGAVNYAQGGPRTFLAEVEKLIHPPPEPPPPKPKLGPVPVLRSARAEAREADPTKGLQLRKITKTKGGRQADINGRTLSAGEVATVRLATGDVRVRCVEVRDKSVVVILNDQRAKHELRLTGGT